MVVFDLIEDVISLDSESDYSKDYTDANTIGKKYGEYFLSSKNNQKAWERRHKKYKNKFETVKDKFKDVKTGFSESDPKALNKICEFSYKATTDTLSDTDISDKYRTRHIWEFCGLFDIKTIEENNDEYKNQIGENVDNKKFFVSVKKPSNDWFWRRKNFEFWEKFNSKEKRINIYGNVFKQLKASNNKYWGRFKRACGWAYKKRISDENNDKKDALLFCSIKLNLTNTTK